MKRPFRQGNIAAGFTELHQSDQEKQRSSDSQSHLCVPSASGWAGAARGCLEGLLGGGVRAEAQANMGEGLGRS